MFDARDVILSRLLISQFWWMGSLCYSRFFLLGALGNAIKFRGGSDLLQYPPIILCPRVCTQEQLVITGETDDFIVDTRLLE